MCLVFHRWGRWETYTETGIMIPGIIAPKAVQGKEYAYTELRQRRVCKDCGKTQDERVEIL